MKAIRFSLLIGVCLATLLTGRQAAAQDAPPDRRETQPTYSPYLNLLRRGGATSDYFGLVRPEQEFRSSDAQFRYSINRLERATGRDARRIHRLEEESAFARELPKLPETGHATRFMDHWPYFPSANSGRR